MTQTSGAPSAPRNNTNNTQTIDLVEVFRVLWHWAWLLLLVTLICGVAGYSFSRFVLPEEFTSTTKIYILNKTDAATTGALSNSDLQASSQLTQDYAELITSHDVLDKVISDLQLPYDYDTLLGKITITTPSDTRIVSIAVTDTDPQMAQTLAIEVREDASAHIKQVMDLDAVNVAEQATLPTEKSAPSNSRWAIVAALIGFLVTAAVLIIRYLMDDTVRTPDDVTKFLEMSTLSQIPSDTAVVDSSLESREKVAQNRRGHGRAASSNAVSHTPRREDAHKEKRDKDAYHEEKTQGSPDHRKEQDFTQERKDRRLSQYATQTASQRTAQEDTADKQQARAGRNSRAGRSHAEREETAAAQPQEMLRPEYTTVSSPRRKPLHSGDEENDLSMQRDISLEDDVDDVDDIDDSMLDHVFSTVDIDALVDEEPEEEAGTNEAMDLQESEDQNTEDIN